MNYILEAAKLIVRIDCRRFLNRTTESAAQIETQTIVENFIALKNYLNIFAIYFFYQKGNLLYLYLLIMSSYILHTLIMCHITPIIVFLLFILMIIGFIYFLLKFLVRHYSSNNTTDFVILVIFLVDGHFIFSRSKM